MKSKNHPNQHHSPQNLQPWKWRRQNSNICYRHLINKTIPKNQIWFVRLSNHQTHSSTNCWISQQGAISYHSKLIEKSKQEMKKGKIERGGRVGLMFVLNDFSILILAIPTPLKTQTRLSINSKIHIKIKLKNERDQFRTLYENVWDDFWSELILFWGEKNTK